MLSKATGRRLFPCDLGLLPEDQSITIQTDKQGAKTIVAHPVQRQRPGHIATPYYYVRQLAKDGVVVCKRVCSSENAADVLTKGVARPFHSFA